MIVAVMNAIFAIAYGSLKNSGHQLLLFSSSFIEITDTILLVF